jgi:hypothetical protein
MPLAEWLYEQGIGENRAILVEDGEIVEAAIEIPGEIRVGAVLTGRLTDILVPGRRGVVATESGEILVEPLPTRVTQGQKVHVSISREAIPEPNRAKLARGRITEEAEREGPSLAERIGACRRLRPTDRDEFEEGGWSVLLEQAQSGEIDFAGGALRMSLTPAMTLFDVDGSLPPAELAVAGAAAAARAIRRLAVGGSIGIDLPTLSGRAERQAAAGAIDALLPPPFERTAVNGFGFLQIVRRRERASIPEIAQGDPAGAGARALLRRAERTAGHGRMTMVAAPAVVMRIKAQPEWIARLEREAGAGLDLQSDERLSISSGHVQRELS